MEATKKNSLDMPGEIFAIPAPSEVGNGMLCLCKRVYWIQDSSLLFIYSPIPKHEAIEIMRDPKTINILKSGPSLQTNLLRAMNGSIYGVPQIIVPVNIQAAKDKLLYKLTSASNAFHVQQTARIPSKSANISATIKRTEHLHDTRPTSETVTLSLPKIESVFSPASNHGNAKAVNEVQHVVQAQDITGYSRNVTNTRSIPDPLVSAQTDDFEIFASIGQPQGHNQDVTSRRRIPKRLQGAETRDFEIFDPTIQTQGLSQHVTNKRRMSNPLECAETEDFEMCAPVSHLQDLTHGTFNGYVWNGKSVGATNPGAIPTMNNAVQANAEVQDLSCHKRNAHADRILNSPDIAASNKSTDSHNLTETLTRNPSSSRHNTYVANECQEDASKFVDSLDSSASTATAREIHANHHTQDLSGFRRVTNEAEVRTNYPVNSPDRMDLYHSKDRTLRRIGSSDSGMESDQSSSSFEIDDPTTYYDNRRRKNEVTGQTFSGESDESHVAIAVTGGGGNEKCADIRDVGQETDVLTETDNVVTHFDDENMLVDDNSLEEEAGTKMILSNASTQTDDQNEPFLCDRTGVVTGNAMVNDVRKDGNQSRTLNQVVDSLIVDGLRPDLLRTPFLNKATRSESSSPDNAVERTSSTADADENSVSNSPVEGDKKNDGNLDPGQEKHVTKADGSGSQIRHPTTERLKLKLRWNKRWNIERGSCPSPFDSDISQSKSHQPSDIALRYRMTDAELALYSPKIRNTGSKLAVVMKRKSPCLKLRRLNKDYVGCVEYQKHLRSNSQEINVPRNT